MTSYASYTTLKCELDGDGVLLVLLNRPDKMNSLDETMVTELAGAMTSAAGDPSVRCVLITGAGRAFSAGRDISAAKPDEDAYDIIANHVNPMLATIYHCPKPTVSAVNGPAMGVGLGIALACDIVIAADNARMSSPFARLGVALDSGGHYFLPRLVGYNRAMEMVYTSDIIRGKQAASWGLVNRSVPGTRLRDRSLELARRIAERPGERLHGRESVHAPGRDDELRPGLRGGGEAAGLPHGVARVRGGPRRLHREAGSGLQRHPAAARSGDDPVAAS